MRIKRILVRFRRWVKAHRLVILFVLLAIPAAFYASFMVNKRVIDKTVRVRTMPIEYLIVHWTANTAPGADATANAWYLQRTHRAGTHLCIDDVEVVECTEEQNVAYAVGDRRWRGFTPKPWLDGKVFNNNSMSFEMCLGGGRNDSLIYETTAQLVGWHLVNKGLDLSRVIRHHDVTGKHCPRFCYNDPEWNQHKEDSCFAAFKNLVNKYYQHHLARKKLYKETGVWVDSIPVMGERTINYTTNE